MNLQPTTDTRAVPAVPAEAPAPAPAETPAPAPAETPAPAEGARPRRRGRRGGRNRRFGPVLPDMPATPAPAGPPAEEPRRRTRRGCRGGRGRNRQRQAQPALQFDAAALAMDAPRAAQSPSSPRHFRAAVLGSCLAELGRIPWRRWRGKAALAFGSYRAGRIAPRQLIDLDDLRLYSLRPTLIDGRTVLVLLVLAPEVERATGRVTLKCVAAYDAAQTHPVPPGVHPRPIDPFGQDMTAVTALQMAWSLLDETRPRGPDALILPQLYFAFRQGSGSVTMTDRVFEHDGDPLMFEDNLAVREAMELDGVRDDDLDGYWLDRMRLFRVEPRGRVEPHPRDVPTAPAGSELLAGWPASFFARHWSERYEVHPMCRTPRPEQPRPDAPELPEGWFRTPTGRLSPPPGWYLSHGELVPRAQEPNRVIAELPLGEREVRNPAWNLLARATLVPHDLTPTEWGLLADRDPKVRTEFLRRFALFCQTGDAFRCRQAMRQLLYAFGHRAELSEAHLAEILACPHHPLRIEGLPPVQVYRVEGEPTPEAMTIRPEPGIELNLFSAGPAWDPHYAPRRPALRVGPPEARHARREQPAS